VEKQNELLEAAQQFLDFHPDNQIRISTRPDCIDEETVARLKSYGVATIELGAQSMCDDVLTKCRRGHTSGDVRQASGIIKSAGLSLILQMMTGLPGDTPGKSLYTATEFIKLKPDGVRIYPTVVVKGTELYKMWQRGDYKEHTIDEAMELCVEICALFEVAGIPVIRLGLHPSDSLTNGDAVAGAYHPALGELVYSKAYYKKAAKLLSDIKPGSDVALAVSKGNISRMAGNRRSNITALEHELSLRSIKLVESDIKPGTVELFSAK